MNVKCVIKDCQSVYTFPAGEKPSSNGCRYVCSKHSDKELRAAGIQVSERTDKDVHFQDHAFDKKLGKAKTRHYTHPLPEEPDLGTRTYQAEEDVKGLREISADELK